MRSETIYSKGFNLIDSDKMNFGLTVKKIIVCLPVFIHIMNIFEFSFYFTG